MKLHPDTEKLRERLRECLDSATSWSGTFYRATTVEYSNRQDLLTGAGSRKTGARWNAAGSFNAVYGCLEPETAMDEALANYRDYGIPVSQALPLVFVAVTVELQSVLDLSNRDVQRTLGISARRMTTTPWREFNERDEEALTQALGRLAFEEKVEGILVPSARRVKHRLVSKPPPSWQFLENRAGSKPTEETEEMTQSIFQIDVALSRQENSWFLIPVDATCLCDSH